MARRNVVSENSVEPSLYRSPDPDSHLEMFPYRRRGSRAQKSVSFASPIRSDNAGSEHSEALYMATPKTRKRSRQSLSSIGNRSERSMDGSSDDKLLSEQFSALVDKERELLVDRAHDELTWKIIDQEIYEWQYVCRTGRPFWWSPEAKYCRQTNMSLSLDDEKPKIWLKEIDDCPLPKYTARGRATTELQHGDSKNDEALAQMIAVQLLSSCFTLPMTAGATEPSLQYPTSPSLPDPRMISSLRMHMQYRYSPAYGHQARSASPTSKWSTIWSASSLHPLTTKTDLVDSNINYSKVDRRKRRVHQKQRTTTDSATKSTGRAYRMSNSLPLQTNSEPMLADLSLRGKQILNFGDERKLDRSDAKSSDECDRFTLKEALSVKQNVSDDFQDAAGSKQNPTHVQPVKRMAFKRLKLFRQRADSSACDRLSQFASEDHISEYETMSPAKSVDGSINQLDKDDDGNSYRSTTRYISEVSISPSLYRPGESTMSPALPSMGFLCAPQTPSLKVRNADGLSKILDEGQSNGLQQISTAEIGLSDSMSKYLMQDTASTRIGYTQGKYMTTDSGSIASSMKRQMARQRRRSRLSEICTYEFLGSEGYFSDANSQAGKGDSMSTVNDSTEVQKFWLKSSISHNLPIKLKDPHSPFSSLPSQCTSPIQSYKEDLCLATSRPRMTRVSTSGTQVFCPADEGVEVDGLPVGPSREIWRGKRRARTYL